MEILSLIGLLLRIGPNRIDIKDIRRKKQEISLMQLQTKRGGVRVDKTTLVERDFSDGELLIRELDEANLNIHSAFWLYDSEAERWRLIIASKNEDFTSPKKA
jgi:hypothetical protein